MNRIHPRSIRGRYERLRTTIERSEVVSPTARAGCATATGGTRRHATEFGLHHGMIAIRCSATT